MSDNIKDLVRMANQVADFFQAYPEDEAVPDIAQHIRDFWTAAMRREMQAHLAVGGAGLKPLALAGLRMAEKDSKAA